MDSDRLFRESLAEILRNENFEVVQLAGSADEVSLEALAQSKHAILVADVQHDEDKVLELFAEGKMIQPNLKIMVVTGSAALATVDRCIDIGVHAYLSKDISSASFRNYLMFVALDEKVMPIDLIKSLRPSRNSSPASAMRCDDHSIDFTPRECAILEFLIEGESNKVIARRLGVADGTVKVGVKSILRKIDATNRTQAAIWALHHKFPRHVSANDDDSLHKSSVAPARHNGSNGYHNMNASPLYPDKSKELLIQFEDVPTAAISRGA